MLDAILAAMPILSSETYERMEAFDELVEREVAVRRPLACGSQ